MSSSGSLVVRVKRRRGQDPAQELIVCEEDDAHTSKRTASEALLQEMRGLSTVASAGPAAARQIVLRRVTTLSAAAGNQMDAVLSSARKRGPDEAELPQPQQQQQHHPQNAGVGRESIWVTQNKRAVRSQEDGTAYVVVDISQVPYHTPSATAATTDDGNKKNPRSPIANPPTRRLEAAIELAWLKNDFNDIAYAIVQGADINHQRPSASSSKESSDEPGAPHLLHGGESALMAAARRCNLRMVSRLLSVGANVFLTDCRGMTAMDHLKQGQATGAGVAGEAFQEISLKLHAAALRSHRARGDADAGTAGADDPASPTGAAGEEDDGEFVVDVFCAAGEGEEAATSTSAASGSGQANSRAAPVVQVGGIKIGQDGAVDLVLAYDSDWSDLGDDEEPDSNDERYHGNDYPDEQDDEEDEGGEDDEEDENYMARRREYQQRSSKKDDSEEDDFDEDEDEDGLNAGGLRGVRQSTGHVVRHALQGGDPFAPAPHTRESIRRLWGETSGLGSEDEREDDEEGEEEEDRPRQEQRLGASVRERFGSGWASSVGAIPARQHRDRVAQMRQASGMEFGSDPRQFDSAGLAKYGAELSDEGEDDAMATGNSPLDTKPPRDALAFDPELDLETDED